MDPIAPEVLEATFIGRNRPEIPREVAEDGDLLPGDAAHDVGVALVQRHELAQVTQMAHRQVLGFNAGTVQDGVLVAGTVQDNVLVEGHEQMRHVQVPSDTDEIIYGDPLPGIWYHLGCASLWAIGFLVIGYAFFMSRKNKFADLV